MSAIFKPLSLAMAFCLLSTASHSQTVDPDQETYIRANTIFFVYHELGHALIDLLRLPVFGQEEDAADVLGVVLSETINDEADNEIIMLAAADNFAYMAETAAQDGYELAFWDTHGLDQQRYYTLLCLHYGADPADRQALADEQKLPEDRQQTCPEEFDLAADSWGPVLEEIERVDVDSNWLIFQEKDAPRNEFEAIVLDALKIEVQVLNEVFDPKLILHVAFERCGEANAYYDPNTRQITICAELAGLFTE